MASPSDIHTYYIFNYCHGDLLNQVQFEDPTPLEVLNDLPGKPYAIPKPEQDPEHMEGDKFKNRHSLEFTAVRNQTWKEGINVPPQIHCPETLYVIKSANDVMFNKAVDHLNKTRTIGVALEGQFLGRHGKLSLISLATPEVVYMFDVVAIGPECFDRGLRQILEDSDIQKGKLRHNVDYTLTSPLNIKRIMPKFAPA